MRVIAGAYGGRTLRGPAGNRTRPTSDRLRETLFNIIAPMMTEETRFLDLCAGTGAIGIEALSRGASFVTFVDKSRRSCGLVEENLDLLRVPASQTEVFCSTADRFLKKAQDMKWDIVFYDPPYSDDYLPVLELLGSGGDSILADGGFVVVEHHAKSAVPDEAGDIRRWRLVKQGETRLSFFERD